MFCVQSQVPCVSPFECLRSRLCFRHHCSFRGGDLEVLCLGFVFHALFEPQYLWRSQLRLCNFGKHTSLFLDFAVFSAHSPDFCLCAQGAFSSYAKKASFHLFSGVMVSDGAHGTWITTEYAQCILCGTVGFRRSFWIRWYVGIGTTRPFDLYTVVQQYVALHFPCVFAVTISPTHAVISLCLLYDAHGYLPLDCSW